MQTISPGKVIRSRNTVPLLLFFTIVFSSGALLAQEPKFGDISDGSRIPAVHKIPLYDETGAQIFLDDQPLMPFSTQETCKPCHSYESISNGWHFNAGDSGVDDGRPGEPWILNDPLTFTQIPISYRDWHGTYTPDELDMTTLEYVREFGRHLPGGGVAEDTTLEHRENYFRWRISGKLEVNCLACHSSDPEYDPAEYAVQTGKENFRWATAGASGFAEVSGTAANMPLNYDIYHEYVPDDPDAVPPQVTYQEHKFTEEGDVFFNVGGQSPDTGCLSCHSVADQETGETTGVHEGDVHTEAGMQCTDCHQEDYRHQTVRGYEGEPLAAEDPEVGSLTCRGCHLGETEHAREVRRRFGAPKPAHGGLPPVHLEELTCTACHSGPLPEKSTHFVKTSRAHRLGTHSVVRLDSITPEIHSPVFVEDSDGHIAPHRLLWPSFWAYSQGDSLEAILPDEIAGLMESVLRSDTTTDSINVVRVQRDRWPQFSRRQLMQVFDSLASGEKAGEPVLISGGKMHKVDSGGNLIAVDHNSAHPYTWPLAHDVRPAAQSLGESGCQDCHSMNSPFYFGKVTAGSPLVGTDGAEERMTTFNDLGSTYARSFAFAFIFRPWLKVLSWIASLLLTGIVLIYGFRGLSRLLKELGQ